MPELFKLLARNCIMGIAAGWTTLALLIITNTGGLGDVVFGSSNPWLPVGVLGVGFAITFGSIAMGAAVMTLPYERDGDQGRGLKVATLMATLKAMMPRFAAEKALLPIPVKDGEQKASYRRQA